jgi:hypothetical protein
MVSLVDGATALAVGIGSAVMKPVRPDVGPLTHRWGLGFGDFAANLPAVPALARPLARHLNRFGSVVLSPGFVEFDGREVPWDRVTEIRTRRLVGYLFTDAITRQVDRLPIWWFPGRNLLLDGLTHTALTAAALAADLRLDRGVFTLYLPADVHYRGLVRDKRMSPGIPAALVLTDPAVRDCVEETARAHGIPVRPAEDDALEAATRRATAIREVFEALIGQVGTRSSA